MTVEELLIENLNPKILSLLKELTLYVPDDDPLRLGCLKNGGYILFQKALENVQRVYSYGVDSNNFNFDLDITGRLHIESHCYACSLNEIPSNKYVIYHPGDLNGFSGTLSEDLKENGDCDKEIVLKVDLEGGEWNFLARDSADCLKNVRQMVIEFHGLLKRDNWPLYMKVLRKINKHFFLCYLQASAFGGGVLVGEKIYLYNKYMATFIRKGVARCVLNKKIHFPTKVDYPNLSGRPYINLDSWPYCSSQKNLQMVNLLVKVMKTKSFFKGLES